MSERETKMVSDQDIAEALESLLRQTNPSSTTFTSFNSVVHHLESKLGLDPHSQARFHPKPDPPPPPPPISPSSSTPPPLHHHQPPPKTHFLLHQNPNFHQPPPFAADELGFRPPPPPKTESSATATTDAAPTDSPEESSQTGKKRRGGPGGLNKLCGLSPELQAIIVKQLWAYIRKNNLQDPSNKRKIICNDELRLVFETDCTDMFKMNKLLAKHIITLEPTKPEGQNSKKPKVEVESETKSAESEPDVIISEVLANFFGTSGREMIQSEVLRHVWEYIKVNQLEDPLNSMVILCDTKLQELFGCASISALGIPEMLARHHLFKIS